MWPDNETVDDFLNFSGVDEYAKQITDWPHSDKSQAKISPNDDGARESRDCVQN